MCYANKFIKRLVVFLLFLLMHYSSAYAQGQSFIGLQQSGNFVPDPVIAVGPNHIVLVVNSNVGIYTKTGTQISPTTSLQTWFSSKNPPGVPFDPKIIYDNISNRWVIFALANNKPTYTKSSYLISVSQTSDPTGLWSYFNLDATKDNGNATNDWADFPGLGYDARSIYITSNQFTRQIQFDYSKIRVINKSDLYNNSSNPSFVDFVKLKDANGLFVKDIKPSLQFGSSSSYYLLNTVSNGDENYVTIWNLTYSNGIPQTPSPSKITLSTTNYIAPLEAVQKGSTNTINAKDCRISDVVYRDGYLYGAFTIQRNDENGNAAGSSIRYLKIDISNNTTVINDIYGEDGVNYFYPEIFPDTDGNIAMVFNRSSANDYVGVAWTYRLTTDQSARPYAWLKQGEGPYTNLVDGINRWGDYSGIAFDPSDGYKIWIYGEYATNNNTWGTWVGEIGTQINVIFTNIIGTTNAGGSFTVGTTQINSGQSLPLIIDNTYNELTNNERFSNWQGSGITYKQNNWNGDKTKYFLNNSFQASYGPNQNQNANFNSLNYAKVQVGLEGNPITDLGNMQFQDPWYVLSDGSQPGNYWIPVTSYYEPVGKAGALDKGVFLNQGINPQGQWVPPYYSVKTQSPQDINLGGSLGIHKFYFQNWSGAGVTFQDPNSAQTAVVFDSSNATAQAVMKGVQLSSQTDAIAGNGQRKIVKTSNGYLHQVYESLGKVWYERSTDNGQTWEIMNGGQPVSVISV